MVISPSRKQTETLRETEPPQYLWRAHPQRPTDVPLRLHLLEIHSTSHSATQETRSLHVNLWGTLIPTTAAHNLPIPNAPVQAPVWRVLCFSSLASTPCRAVHRLLPGVLATPHTCGSASGTVSVTLPSATAQKVWVRPCTARSPLAVAPRSLLCSLSTPHDRPCRFCPLVAPYVGNAT